MARRETRGMLADLKREITIAGGGLAGLALASALRQHGVPVMVLEAGSYPRHRVCGEFISGTSAETLERLGIAGLFEGALGHRTLAWHDSGKMIHRDRLEEPAIGISRHLLDERLHRHALEAGAEVRTGTRARPEPREGLVWAAGRRPTSSRWIGLKAHVRGVEMAADLEMHMGRNGYVGLAGVEDGWTNVCGLFQVDRSRRSNGPELLMAYLEAGGNGALADTLRGGEWREDSFSAVAGFALGRQAEVPGLLALGDAESMIPPFTGNGMSMAFQSAELAIDPLLSWSCDGLAWQEAVNRVRHALHGKFRRRLTVAGAVHPLLMRPAGRSLLQTLASARLLPLHPLLSLVR